MYAIDSQIHIWAAETPDRPWIPGGQNYTQRAEPYDAEEVLREMDGASVNRAVLVPPSWEGDRNELALDAAKRYPDRFAVMGRIDLTSPENAALLATWRSQPGMLGVRLTFNRSPHKEWLFDGTADWFWEAAEAARVPVMVLATGCTARIGEIAAKYPGLPLIIDHVGLPAKPDYGAVDAAVDEAIKVAEYPNLAVKASALPVHATDSFPFVSLQQPIVRLVRAFGSDRIFWGTDLTRLPCPYREAVELFTDAIPDLSEDEKEAIMGRSLATWLDWQIPDAPWNRT